MTLRADSYTILAGAMFSASSYVEVNQMFKLTMSSALLFEDYTSVQDRCASQLALRSSKSFQTDFLRCSTVINWRIILRCNVFMFCFTF